MSWIKLDDQFADHPKVIAAGPLAAWLYVCGLTYCGRYLTDGWIPEGQVRKLADLDDAAEQAQRLVDVGLWERVDDGYIVHDYLEYNPTGAKVKSERAANARRQAEWRERNRQDDGQFGDDVTDAEAECNDARNGERNGVTNAAVTTAPSPSPSPSPSPNSGGGGDARGRDSAGTEEDALAGALFTEIERTGVLVNATLAEAWLDAIEDHRDWLTEQDVHDAFQAAAAANVPRPGPAYVRSILDRCKRENARPGEPRRNGSNARASPEPVTMTDAAMYLENALRGVD